MTALRIVITLTLLSLAGWQGTRLYQTALAARQKPPSIPTARVAQGELRFTLSGTGILEAANTVMVTSEQVSSQIVDIVADGVLVTKGQTVVTLDHTKVEKDLRERQLAYENAKAQVKKVEAASLLDVNNAATKMAQAQQEKEQLGATNRAELAQAQARLQFNRSELDYNQRSLERTQRLAKDQLVAASLTETAELTVKSKELDVTQGQREVSVKEHEQRSASVRGEIVVNDARFAESAARNKSDEQVKNAQLNAEAARRLVELAQRQMGWCDVRAPVAGLTVVARTWTASGNRPLRPGDMTYPYQQFLDIIDLSRMRVVADMSDMDASYTKQGQAVRVSPRSAPEQSIRGRILSISNLARQANVWRAGGVPGKRTFRVVVELLESRPDVLRPGMTADFEIMQGQIAKTLRVPLQGLFPTPKGTVVFVKRGARFVTQPVKLGRRSATAAAVLSGLKEGEEIALRRPPAALLDAAGGAKKRAL
jgi:multidrug efflux pump subunit AcrA (membrane-fusion protein)